MIKHTCGGPIFGRLAPEGTCPRCDELRAGAPRRTLPWYEAAKQKKENEKRFYQELKNHDCKKAGCGPVCTFGDW